MANTSRYRVKITDKRAHQTFASYMRDLVDMDYRDAARIRVVMDIRSTHSAAAIYQTLPAAAARRMVHPLERL